MGTLLVIALGAGGFVLGTALGRWQRKGLPNWLERRLQRRLTTHTTPDGEVPTASARVAFRFATGSGAYRLARFGALTGVLGNALVYVISLLLGHPNLLLQLAMGVGTYLAAHRNVFVKSPDARFRQRSIRHMRRQLLELQANTAIAFVANHPTPQVLRLVGEHFGRALPVVQQQLLLCLEKLATTHPELKSDLLQISLLALQAEEEPIRQQALSLTAKLDRRILSSRLGMLMKDRSPAIRRAALQLYDLLPYQGQVELLTDALRDPHPDVQRSALQLIQTSNPIGETEWLQRAQDPNPTVRQTAARALGAYNHPIAIQTLKQLLTDREDLVQQAAMQALASQESPEAAEVLAERLVGEIRPEKLILMVRALGRRREQLPEKAMNELLALLGHKQEPVRIAASEALVQAGEPAVGPLITILREEGERSRIAAARSLLLLRHAEGLQALAALSSDSSAELRRLALSAVAQLNPEMRLHELINRLDDNDSAVRLAAINELTKLQDRRALPALYARYKALKSAVIAPLLSEGSRTEQGLLQQALQQLSAEQRGLVPAYPYLYCVTCRRKPRVQGELGFQFVSCGNCTDLRQMRTGVLRVVGYVGPRPPQEEMGGTLYLPLWDAQAETAQPADLDALHLQGGDPALNYDWAISAVLQALADRMGTDALKTLAITQEALPPLAENTQRLLAAAGVEHP